MPNEVLVPACHEIASFPGSRLIKCVGAEETRLVVRESQPTPTIVFIDIAKLHNCGRMNSDHHYIGNEGLPSKYFNILQISFCLQFLLYMPFFFYKPKK